MHNTVIDILVGSDYATNQQEVTRQNRLAIRYFAAVGIPVALINYAAQSITRGALSLSWQRLWLLCYFVALLVAERYLIPQNCKRATWLVYIVQAPVMIISILLGTVWDPSTQALTFLMFMIVMPVFILDRPIRVMGVTLFWNLVFLTLCLAFKDPATHRPDFLHDLEFYLLSLAITYTVLRLRFEVISNLNRTRYSLEHDRLTDTYNRISLEDRLNLYVGKRLFLCLADIDHFSLINDSFGNETAEEVLRTFAENLKGVFGQAHVYRYVGDEFVCITAGSNADLGMSEIAQFRKQFASTSIEGLRKAPSCSFGYVIGTPHDVQELNNMIQLAIIYAHQVKRDGTTDTIGGPYDEGALREGITESRVNGHARNYEIDHLTGLPNLPYFISRAEELLDGMADPDLHPTVGYLNIVHFREYNNQFGYAKGDDLIRTMTRLLKQALPNRHIAYMTGSQFAFICYNHEIERTMDYVRAGLERIQADSPIEFRAGFATYHEGESVISLIDKAKLAHDNVDERSDCWYRFYDEQLDSEIHLRHYLVTHLDTAITEGWLKVHYQPIVDIRTGQLCNMEALSRWIDPIYGLLSPAQFINALEEERLLYKLSLNVIRQALIDLSQMQKAGYRTVPVSVNLSRNDFFDCDIVKEVCDLVDASDQPRSMIKIELTESVFTVNQTFLSNEVDRFRSEGFEVWMDDFGSEYSTLNLLEELNVDLIKLDMRFMRNFDGKGRNATIVAAIIDMCHRLRISTLVEGVETQDQCDILSSMGCDRIQGYLYSPPRQLADLISFSKAKGWM